MILIRRLFLVTQQHAVQSVLSGSLSESESYSATKVVWFPVYIVAGSYDKVYLKMHIMHFASSIL